MPGRDDRLKVSPFQVRSAPAVPHPPRLVEVTFQPAWWCPGHHTQTIYSHLFRPRPPVAYQRKRLETPDGDFLDLDFMPGPSERPLVLVLHGLEGSSRSRYVRNLLAEFQKAGWRGCAMNYRGCSGEPNRLPITYHSGKTEDLDLAVRAIAELEYPRKFFIVGFSIGGNLLLKWLGERGSDADQWIEKAVAVSVPYDLARSAALMDQGFNRIVYTRKLLIQLRFKAFQKLKQYPKLFRPWKVFRSGTFQRFDNFFTAPVNGFRDAEDYWTRSSCEALLAEIRVQTGLLHAEDDPFYPGALFPHDPVRRSGYLEPIWTYHGGHMGFVAGSKLGRMEAWQEQTILRYFGAAAG